MELLLVKSHFEAILKSMTEGILEMTPAGRIVYANPSAISLMEIPEDRLLASDFTQWLSKPEGRKIKDLLAETKIHPEVKTLEPPLTINEKQVSLKFLPIKDETHETVMVLLNDETERKRIEAQLFHAQKMEAIATLAGGIAHDFNNLLMVIQGNVSLMLLDMLQTHPHYEMLKSIEKEVQSGSRLTAQLLGYARKGRYEVKTISLNELVEEISEAFGRTRKNITFHHQLAKDLFFIKADQGQMKQVLMNLFINAADAMPEGGDLFLMTSNVTQEDIKGKLYKPEPGSYVLLAVKDSGVGMDSETLKRIFDPFFTTKELGRGTGLGLASAYGIVKGHRGYIEVESEKGQGTTFKIYLPASGKRVPEHVKPADRIVKGKETILLIDDEERILRVAGKFLRLLGYQVMTSQTGKEAIKIYKEYKDSIALVLLDMIMPGMGGDKVFDQLKEINPEIKVLLSSGYSIDNEAIKALEGGCKGFIQKPFNIAQLSQSVRSILKKK